VGIFYAETAPQVVTVGSIRGLDHDAARTRKSENKVFREGDEEKKNDIEEAGDDKTRRGGEVRVGGHFLANMVYFSLPLCFYLWYLWTHQTLACKPDVLPLQ
jgi:hypothetical protein